MEKITTIEEARMLSKRAPGAAPLPKRWMRARRWISAHGYPGMNTQELKMMLNAENRGQG